MAELLKREYDLVDLRVSLETNKSDTSVHCQLEVTTGGNLASVADWQFPIEELRLPAHFGRGVRDWSDFAFPEHVFALLKNQLVRLNHRDALWLHLVRPYGALGLVPWEQLLQPRLGIPILRLPDFLSGPPLESRSALDVLICTSVPVAKEEFESLSLVRQIVDQARSSVPRTTRFHLFTDKAVFDQFELQPIPNVTAYDPNRAASYSAVERSSTVPDAAERLQSPWLQWMRDALLGKSIDAVHFVCHGYLSVERGALALAESPLRNQDSRMARFIGTAEFITFLTQIGAWAAAFSGPSANFSQRQPARFAARLPHRAFLLSWQSWKKWFRGVAAGNR